MLTGPYFPILLNRLTRFADRGQVNVGGEPDNQVLIRRESVPVRRVSLSTRVRRCISGVSVW
jgi:hypothetical protein